MFDHLIKVAFSVVPRAGHERYNAALDRWRSGQRQTKPLPGEFGLQGLRTEPAHRTAEKIKTVQPHQQSGVDFIVQHHGQGILAHSTGSGKTITAVKAFDKLKELGKARKALVITPAGLRTNFLVEGVHRASDHKGSILTGQGERGADMFHWSQPDPDSTYHVVSYEIFREHPEEIIKATGADTLILDEFHRVKDPDRDTFKRLDQVRPLVKNVIGLTGSVVSTHPSNILQPIEAVTGGQHGLGTKEQFEAKYLTRAPAPLKKRKPVVLSKPTTWLNWFRPREPMKGRKTEFTGWKNTGELQRHLQQHIHYVGPELVAEKMPEKYVDTVRVEMSPFQEQVYRAALKELPAPLLRKLEAGHPMVEGEQGEVFNRVIKARQAANSVHTMTGLTPEEAAPSTPKLQKMLDDIEDHFHQTPDGGAIVYSNLVHGGIDIIRAGLKQRGIPHGLFIGKGNEGVTEESRQQDVRDFRAGKIKVMVVSGAGNEGVSLPNATFHAAYDGHWNPEKILQAEARGWRLGGQAHRPQADRKVHVRRYMTVWPESRSLMGKVTSYFKGQKESDAVDSWIYNWADKRHNLNAQLHDLLKGEPAKPHSLFAEGRGLYDTPAVEQKVEAPKLDPNYKPPVKGTPVTVHAPPPPKADLPWWQTWKGSSLEGPLHLDGYDTEKLAAEAEGPTDGLVYFIPHDVSSGFHPEPSHHAQDEQGNWGHFGERPPNHFHHVGILHGEHAYEKDHQGNLQVTSSHDRIPQLLADGAQFIHTPLDIAAVHASHPPNIGSEEMVARALNFSLRSGEQQGVLQPSEIYRILLNQPHASELQFNKAASEDTMNAAIGLGGFEPQGTGNYEAGTPIRHEAPAAPAKRRPGGYTLPPPIIVNPGEYVDEHTQRVHAALPWLNKDPGMKAAAHRIRGVLEGFPGCCIDAFVEEEAQGLAPAMERMKLGWDDDSGYVPCEACYKTAHYSPEPQVGEKVEVTLENRLKHDDFTIVPMGFIRGRINPADDCFWDAIPIDVPLHKVKGTVEGTVIGKLKDRKGNDKLVVKSEPGPLTERQKQNLQAYQAARQVWAGNMTMQVPGVKDVNTKVGGRLFFAHAAMAFEKGAEDEEGGVLSVICRILDHEKRAFQGEKLGPVIRIGHHDQLLHIKRDLRGRFTGLSEPRGQPHVTLLYAHGLQDAAHPHLIEKVKGHLDKKQLRVSFTRLGTFNNGGKGIVFLAAEGQGLHDTHKALRGAAAAHGAKFHHRTFRPHMTLFYRDKPFSPEERASISKMRVSPIHLDRDRSHIDVTIKRGQGWQKLAQEDLELLAGSPELYRAAEDLTKAALETTRYWRQIPFPEPEVYAGDREAWVDLPSDMPFAKASALAEEIAEALRAMPEVVGSRITLSKEARVRVTCDFSEPQPPDEVPFKVAGALEAVLQTHPGIRLKEANTEVRVDDDLPPIPKRWVEPKYRRPACWVNNHTDHSRIFAEYANPQQAPHNLP